MNSKAHQAQLLLQHQQLNWCCTALQIPQAQPPIRASTLYIQHLVYASCNLIPEGQLLGSWSCLYAALIHPRPPGAKRSFSLHCFGKPGSASTRQPSPVKIEYSLQLHVLTLELPPASVTELRPVFAPCQPGYSTHQNQPGQTSSNSSSKLNKH